LRQLLRGKVLISLKPEVCCAPESEVEILWSADRLKSALLINHLAYAVFDFFARRGYCRTNFPRRHAAKITAGTKMPGTTPS
jgi:hypothetical protein